MLSAGAYVKIYGCAVFSACERCAHRDGCHVGRRRKNGAVYGRIKEILGNRCILDFGEEQFLQIDTFLVTECSYEKLKQIERMCSD